MSARGRCSDERLEAPDLRLALGIFGHAPRLLREFHLSYGCILWRLMFHEVSHWGRYEIDKATKASA